MEECYEFIDSVAQGDYQAIKDELGDLLYHIVFYSAIAEENDLFSFDDLAAVALKKHEERMPSKEQLQHMSAQEVSDYWDKAKTKKDQQTKRHLLDDVGENIPATLQAKRLQERAASVGFDWPDVKPVYDKIKEELQELEEAHNGDQEEREEELGDLLFACVNLARHYDINPETALRRGNQKFKRRFRSMEIQADQDNQTLTDLNLEQLEVLWEQAKTKERETD